MTFALDLDKFAKNTSAKANMVVRKIVFDVDKSLVLKSPVGNPDMWAATSLPAPKGYVGGRFRANWQYGDGSAPSGVLFTPIVGPYPEQNNIDVSEDAGGKMHFLVNNLPYGERLEDGWSKQSPSGMVSLTVIEFTPIVEAAAKAIKAMDI